MPLLIPHPILHPTRSSRNQRDIHTLAGAVVSAKSEGSQNQPRSLARGIGLTWLFLFMTMQPNSAFADQPNFDSHSNQDALDFSDHRQTKKKRPPPPGEPTPPPPPGGRRQAGKPKSPASLLLLAHQLGPSDHTAHPEFGNTSGLHFTKPSPSAAEPGREGHPKTLDPRRPNRGFDVSAVRCPVGFPGGAPRPVRW